MCVCGFCLSGFSLSRSFAFLFAPASLFCALIFTFIIYTISNAKGFRLRLHWNFFSFLLFFCTLITFFHFVGFCLKILLISGSAMAPQSLLAPRGIKCLYLCLKNTPDFDSVRCECDTHAAHNNNKTTE